MQHDTAMDGDPVGPEDDDHGPPDWLAAVAEPEPAPFVAGPAPEPARRRASARRPAAGPTGAGGPRGSEGAPGFQGSDGFEGPDGGLGLVSASELPTGRRRRRSALEEEDPGRWTGSGAAGHGGAAAPSSTIGPDSRRARTRTRTRADRTGRTTGAEYGPEHGLEHGSEHGPAGDQDGAGRAGKPRRAGRAARAEDQADPETRARDICLRLLTGAAKSRKQLADALRKREIPDEVAEQVLTRLEEVGLIDDAAFAQAWVESRHAVRGLSRRALAQELRTKGVTGERAEQALAQVDQDDETEAARALVERKLRTTRGLERQARTRRLVGVLARRGYSEGLAYRVVREALDEEAGTGPAEEDVDGAPADEWD
ncbi:regulatory protein RecX [Kitasatospora sp. NBC_01560]|uniref:regulatory protein RecX n=1 Tax=Kitasatospora sp. NBC_01560 TaxID=2975965 RepID=UPI0038681731